MTDKDFMLHVPLIIRMMKNSSTPLEILKDFINLTEEQRETVTRMYEVYKI